MSNDTSNFVAHLRRFVRVKTLGWCSCVAIIAWATAPLAHADSRWSHSVPTSLKVEREQLVSEPQICNAAKRNLKDQLENPNKTELYIQPFPAANVALRNIGNKFPLLRRKTDEDSLDRSNVADAVIGGVKVALVDIEQDGECAGRQLEIWTPKFRSQLYPTGLADSHPEPISEGLETYRGRNYLVQKTMGPLPKIKIFDFTGSRAPRMVCDLVPTPVKPEQVEQAANEDLCNAVREGKVGSVAMETGEPVAIDAAKVRVGELLDPDKEWRCALENGATVDLFNDGKPVRLAMAICRYDSGPGCVAPEQWEYPVVLLAEDHAPDLSLPVVTAGGDSAHLIRYRGVVYVDGRSTENSGRPFHWIQKVTRNGSATVCKFNSMKYESAGWSSAR